MLRNPLFTICATAALLLAACGEEKRGSNPRVTADAGGQQPTAICGNGAINGLEPCDGTAIAGAMTCDSLGLGGGTLSCTDRCALDLSTCNFRDYCTANNLYANGQCDNCELLGGVADPECMTACAGDGMCGDRFDPLTGQWTCRRRNLIDPDCGMCGNQIIEGNELCDGMTQRPQTSRCEDWGYEEGTLGCMNCLPVFTGCRAAMCGDSRIEGPETCEGTNVNGSSCTSFGFAGGNLTCTSTCGFSFEGCVAPGCGNQIIEPDLQEECEGTMFNGTTCDSLGYAGGTLACDGSCRRDTTNCVNPGCGNMIIEAPLEECEGTNLNGGTCEAQGFVGGMLTCSPASCTFDTSLCVAAGCGNMIIEQPDEQCEGTMLNGGSCESLGFLQGTLTCDPKSCRYDTDQCVQSGCGNMIIEAPTEECEAGMLSGASCQSLGFTTGTLGCDNLCQYDTSNCSGTPCGDGTARGLESCDTSDFNYSNDCNNYGVGFGTMSCRSDCRLDFSACVTDDVCNANNWYSDGVCDACQFYGGTADPDCTISCGSDGVCVSYFDGPPGGYTCAVEMGAHDPDCGCGNGALGPLLQGVLISEVCEASSFASGFSTCANWAYSGGTLSCGSNCLPIFTACTP